MVQGRRSRLVAGILLLTSFFGSSAFAKRLVPVDTDPTPAPGVVVTVKSETAPLARAKVWVESLGGKLLAEGETDGEGRFNGTVSESDLKAGVSVTAHAKGFSAVTFLENVSARVTLELPALPVDSYSILKGKLTGFPDIDDETKAMVGLVAKGLEVTDLVQLDSSSFVSPIKDTIDVFGRREIPSNIVLPDQTFPVYFIPVRVNKPIYRLPVLTGSSSRYFGVTGTVDVQQAINAIRGDNAWDIINLLEFKTIGISNPVAVPKPNQNIALDVRANTAIKQSVTLTPGRNTSTENETRRLAVAVWEPISGVFVPSDVKVVEDDRVRLSTVDNRASRVMDLFVNGEGTHFRGAWMNPAVTRMPDAGLTADLVVNSLENTWTVRGGENAQLVIAHLESRYKTSVGNHRYDDKWVIVGPRKGSLRLPQVALRAFQGASTLGKISHVSVDLMQLASGSYPLITGESTAGDLTVLEKVRKELK